MYRVHGDVFSHGARWEVGWHLPTFKVGDKVVYPMHGAGIIEAIEEREVLGQRQPYYIMKLPFGDMQVMIPLRSVEEVGLREVISSSEVERVFEVLQGEKTKMSQNWNRRYRANLEKIRSGDIFEVAEVVRNLTIRDREKGLSTGERRMLDSARQILISELVLAQGLPAAEVERRIDEVLGG